MEQLRDITNLEVAPDTDQGYKIMTNEAKLMEAMWAFLFWQTAHPTELVKMTAGKHDYEVVLFSHDSKEEAKRLESEVKEKLKFLYGTSINYLEDMGTYVIHLIWKKED